MKKELSKPVAKAIITLTLILLIKFVSMLILKNIAAVYSIIEILLSIAVIAVLLKFRLEFNRELEGLQHFQAKSIVSSFVYLLVILTLYGAFIPYSGILPYGLFYILFFFSTLIPVYSLWKILYKQVGKSSAGKVLQQVRFTFAGERQVMKSRALCHQYFSCPECCLTQSADDNNVVS